MKSIRLVGVAPLLLLACVVFAAVPGRAAAVPSDVLIVYNAAGGVDQMVTANESQETGGNKLFFVGVTTLADPAG